MKKYFSYLSIALVTFVFASCGLKGNHTSSGRAYELLVVVDHGVWDRAAGRALHDALDSDMPGLPQSEPSFRIMYTSPKDYDSTLKLIRNIIIVDIQDIYTKASFKYAKDVYANPQIGYPGSERRRVREVCEGEQTDDYQFLHPCGNEPPNHFARKEAQQLYFKQGGQLVRL